jgi:hypothetical protein
MTLKSECGQSENNCQNLNTKNSEKFSEFLGYETKFLRNLKFLSNFCVSAESFALVSSTDFNNTIISCSLPVSHEINSENRQKLFEKGCEL